jgi:hypothetical protein
MANPAATKSEYEVGTDAVRQLAILYNSLASTVSGTTCLVHKEFDTQTLVTLKEKFRLTASICRNQHAD